MRRFAVAIGCVVASALVSAQSTSHRALDLSISHSQAAPIAKTSQVVSNKKTLPVPTFQHTRVGVVSDWTQRNLLFSTTNNRALLARAQKDPRWVQSWYLHHRGAWWTGSPRRNVRIASKGFQRDWNVPLGTVTFAPIIEGGNTDPGGGQTFPAKYTFDVTATPSCTNDFVTIGLPATPAVGGQANIVGYNNLYTSGDTSGYCYSVDAATAPSVLFAYASGVGEIPASVSVSLDGTQLAYVEDLMTGGANFHVLTIGTTGNNGASATAAVAPSIQNGVTLNSTNNASDWSIPLTPDGIPADGVENSTTAPFIDYTTNAAYVTTYTWSPHGAGYIYKISPVFGGGTPAIVWAALVDCSSSGPPGAPSSPVYDSLTNDVFFTDTGSRIDYVNDTGASPTVTCGNVGTYDDTAANPPVVDVINEKVYGAFNDNSANEYVTQISATDPTGSSLGVTVGGENTTYTGPYGVDFSNDYYNCDVSVSPCSGTPLLYAAGEDDTGTDPVLYAVGFGPDLAINSPALSDTFLTTGAADASPVAEFYNATTSTDYLFVGVTNNCAATLSGGTGGCVMSLDITSGPPTVNSSTTALPAAGGPTGIVVDNDANTTTYPEASSIYYATRTGATLVKATQSGLN